MILDDNIIINFGQSLQLVAVELGKFGGQPARELPPTLLSTASLPHLNNRSVILGKEERVG